MRNGEAGPSEIAQLLPAGGGCSVCGTVEQLRKGMCQKHYWRLKKTGTTDDPQPQTHCGSGHEFTPENTYVHQGKRGCRECRKITQREAYRRTVPVKCRVCDTPARRHGLCQAHYDRQRFYGDPLAGPPKLTVAVTAEEKAQRLRDASRRYRDGHLEQERERNRRYREENWLATRERHHRWLMANAERWYPDLYAGQEAPQPDPVDFAAILAEFGMVCHLCGGEIASPSDLDFDHVIPRALGGQHVYENIRPTHAVCNRRKGAKLLP
jgi:5-methylcytosine-specific restriction endonuclease McrA